MLKYIFKLIFYRLAYGSFSKAQQLIEAERTNLFLQEQARQKQRELDQEDRRFDHEIAKETEQIYKTK